MKAPKTKGFHQSLAALHGLLRGETQAEDLAADFQVPAARLRAYRSFVQGHVVSILEKNFPELHELLGCQAFHRLAEAFEREVPCQSFELNQNCRAFPDFLAQKIEAGDPDLKPFHVELAILEFAEFEAFAHPAEDLAPPTLEGPTLNPTLSVFEFDYPVAEVLARIRGGEALPQDFAPEPSPQVVFVLRHPQSGVAFNLAADDSLLFAFKVAHDQMQISEAAEAAHADPQTVIQVLKRAQDEGLVVLPDPLEGNP